MPRPRRRRPRRRRCRGLLRAAGGEAGAAAVGRAAGRRPRAGAGSTRRRRSARSARVSAGRARSAPCRTTCRTPPAPSTSPASQRPRCSPPTASASGRRPPTAAAAGDDLELFAEVDFPHSLGLFYSTLTAYLGFRVDADEYKVMGLAPYGTPRYAERLRRVLRDAPGPGFALDLDFFDFIAGERMDSHRPGGAAGRAAAAAGGAADRLPRRRRRQRAAGARGGAARQGAMAGRRGAGGGPLPRRRRRPELRRQRAPAARRAVRAPLRAAAGGRRGRGGGSGGRRPPAARRPSSGDRGARLAARRRPPRPGLERRRDRRPARRLGPRRTTTCAATSSACWRRRRGASPPARWSAGSTAAPSSDRGRSGRAASSPIPRDPAMRDRLNRRIKQREDFRPFAPAVLAERAAEHFALGGDRSDRRGPAACCRASCCRPAACVSPLELPAVTHVDGSARPQTVEAAVQPRFAALLAAFERLTGCPMLLNTSFNVRRRADRLLAGRRPPHLRRRRPRRPGARGLRDRPRRAPRRHRGPRGRLAR